MKTDTSGPVAWMVQNHVAANLLMIIFLVGGYLALTQVRQEVFPTMELDTITVSVAYPGANPQEVELAIVQVIEAQVRALDGVKRMSSISREGLGTVTIELQDYVDHQEVLQDVKNEIDRIRTFPEQAERAQVKLNVVRRVAMRVMVHGQQPDHLLRKHAERIRFELSEQKGITLVEIDNPQTLETAISIQQDQLLALNLTLEDIANKISASAQSLPAGGIKTEAGEVLVRVNERRFNASEFQDIPITTQPGLGTIYLGDIAEIKDGFEDNDQRTFFNNEPAIGLNIYSVGNESPVDVANITKAYIEDHRIKHPGLKLTVFEDGSEIFKGRVNLLIKNAAMGLVLVLLILGFFLDARLAFWVMLGLPISILGSFLFFSLTGATINMVSLFVFFITLGSVFEDAILVGEAIHEARLQGASKLDAAKLGAKEMSMPVIFAVLTNLLAFMPLFFVPGVMGDIFGQIPAVVVSVLSVSLIESLLVLPAHLGHSKRFDALWHLLNQPQRWFGKKLDYFIEHHFSRHIKWVLHFRYITIALGVGCLILCVGIVAARLIPFSFLPRIDRDTIVASAQLPVGSPIEHAQQVLDTLVENAYLAAQSLEGKHIIKGVYATIGSGGSGSHNIRVTTSLTDSQSRDSSGLSFARQWRELTTPPPGVKSLSFSGQIGVGGSGSPIQIEIAHPDPEQLKSAAIELAKGLKQYQGVTDIDNGIELGKKQIDISLTPLADNLGITTAMIARQVRATFYGVEALRQQRLENEVKVIVRLSQTEREQLNTLKQLRITAPNGQQIPLTQLAHFKITNAYTSIERIQGRRILKVTADIDFKKTNLNEVLIDIKKTQVPKLEQRFPQLTLRLGGEETTRQESLAFLKKGMLIALLGIYLVLAVPFGSYTQPLAVMLSIPFGCVGALLGHFALGFEISIISLIGIIGLSGIVINDALVLIVTINRLRTENQLSPLIAAQQAAIRRFRPILLTSLTTFFGLLPMLFETSVQARFLIPMAISIGFGVLFATAITLALVPALYLVIDDCSKLFTLPFSNNPQSKLDKS